MPASRDVGRDRSANIVNGGGIGVRSLRFRYQVPGFLAETIVQGGLKLTGLWEDELGLEEVFLRVTRGETQ